MTYDCIIIGAGPGGLVAGIYLCRLRRSVLVVSSGRSRAERIPKIGNLVGYSEGISGTRLLTRLNRQYRKFGGERLEGLARVERTRKGFIVHVGERRLQCRKVILATGMRDIEPEVPGLEELTRKGLIGYCPICDAFDHTRERIALLLASPAGLKKAAFMLGFSPRLVVVKTAPFPISVREQDRLSRLGIELMEGVLETIAEAPSAPKLRITMKGGARTRCDSAYVLLGASCPSHATKRMRGLKRMKDGYLRVSPHQETSVKGLYAVGDCVEGLSQISVAIGQAAIAATHVHNKLRPKV